MPLKEALAAVHVIEAAENYALAEVPAVAERSKAPEVRYGSYGNDESFWEDALHDGVGGQDRRISFWEIALSEWVARVPGLYWAGGSAALRSFGADAVEGHDLGGVTLRPVGKSGIVSGGIGTLKLPPAADGHRLCTVTTSANASTGAPVLVSPEVWEHHRLGEGSVLRTRSDVAWRAMPHEWASRFPSMKGIPRGCLVLDDPDAIEVYKGERAGIQVHPFSIMRYASGHTELFDFVFATGNSADSEHRGKLSAFFEKYRNREGRYGEYLVSADIADPLWDARYASPEALRSDSANADSQYRVMVKRLEERVQGLTRTEDLLQALCSLPSSDDLRRVADLVEIPAALWAGGTLAEQAARLVARLPPDKVTPFLEALARDYPGVMDPP